MAKDGKTMHAPKGSGASWIKENPGLAKLALLGVLLAVLLVIVVVGMLGSGGKDSRRSAAASAAAGVPDGAPPPPRPTSAGPEQPPDQDSPKGDENEQNADPASAEPPTQPTGEPNQPADTAGPANPSQPPPDSASPEAKPERPENVAGWKLPDYLSARAENDPRLLEAVGQLGPRFAGNPNAARVAEILGELLAPPKADGTEQPPSGGRAASFGGSANLIETLVVALGDNGTDTARKILEQLIAGERPTEDDRTAAMAALEALADHPCAENEAILFRALTEPEKIRPPDRGDVTAEELRTEAIALVESEASEEFRAKLAEYLAAAGTPEQLRTELGEFLEQSHPANVAAQLVLYRSDDTPGETKSTLEEYFAAYSSGAMAEMLGVSADAAGRSGGRPTRQPRPGGNIEPPDSEQPDPDLPYRPARRLWGPQCLAMLEERLRGLESIEEQSQLVALAGTIPVDAMRSTLLKTLTKHWGDGPAGLKSTGLAEQLVGDPALVPVVKALCRKPTSRAAGRDALEKLQQNKEAWAEYSDDLVRAWCERFHAAAQSRTEAAEVTDRNPADGNPAATLPIKLHADAKVAAEYHLDFPGAAATHLAGVAVGPMQIHYIRIEEKARLKARLGYYRRQLGARSSDVRQRENTDWVESYRTVPDTDRRRSLDVLITRTEARSGAAAGQKDEDGSQDDEDEDLIVEVLSIETRDPSKG